MPPQHRRPAVFLQLSYGRFPDRRVAQAHYGVNAHILDKQPQHHHTSFREAEKAAFQQLNLFRGQIVPLQAEFPAFRGEIQSIA